MGQTVTFGSYEQNGNGADGAEALSWLVLAVDGTKALVITQQCIDCMPYHYSRVDVNWQGCSLRSWLNESFYHTAFSDSQRSAIQLTHVQTPNNGASGTLGGADTMDNIFLLSEGEVQFYGQSVSLASGATAYTMTKGAGSKGSSVYWWTRTPGTWQSSAKVVDTVDCKIFPGDSVDCVDNAVRPAMWVDTTMLGL